MDSFLIYIAGFFDGEGHVGIQKKAPASTRSHSPYSLIVGVSNVDGRPLQMMRERWGGSLVLLNRTYPQRDIYRLIISGKGAAAFLSEVVPHLIVKKLQAELGLEFYQHVQDCKDKYRHIKGKKGIQPLPPEVLAIRDDYVRRIRELNFRGRTIGN